MIHAKITHPFFTHTPNQKEGPMVACLDLNVVHFLQEHEQFNMSDSDMNNKCTMT